MKALSILLLSLAATFSAQANSVTVTPAGYSDLKDLDHSTAVAWGFNLSSLQLGPLYKVTSATIAIKGLNDWTIENNDHLYIDLLDNPRTGEKYYSDLNDAASDYFLEVVKGKRTYTGGPVTALTVFEDKNDYVETIKTQVWNKWKHRWEEKISYKSVNPAEDFSYSFTSEQLGELANYLSTAAGSGHSNLGLSFDGDCHYNNCGVSFTVTTEYVPETSTTFGLLGLSLAGLAAFRRRRA